jgi:two-component system chemotaxis response regulator CheY
MEQTRHSGALLRRLRSVRACVVEDNIHMCRIVCAILRGFGIQNTEVFDEPTRALRHCEDGLFDLIILDYQMPTVDGVDFIRLVRRSAGGKNVFTPIILLSAYTEAWRVVAARDAGVTEVCAKPIAARELWSKIAHITNVERCFIRSSDFWGPDRRRRDEPIPFEERRGDARPARPAAA